LVAFPESYIFALLVEEKKVLFSEVACKYQFFHTLSWHSGSLKISMLQYRYAVSFMG